MRISHVTFIIFLSFIFLVPGPDAHGEVLSSSCECASLACGVCEIEVGVSFYTEKCGVAGSRVKSCKKPSCEPVKEQKACLAALEGEKSSANKTEVAESRFELQDSNAQRTEEASTRLPATKGSAEAGEITALQGPSRVYRVDGSYFVPKKKDTVHVGETVETSEEGVVKIKLRDDSEMTVAPKSKLKIEAVDVNRTAAVKRVALQLLSGKVRSKVQKQFSESSTFEVKTRSAVAGVRGTDFITSFEPGLKEWVSEVRTLSGLVQLSLAPELGTTGDGASSSLEISAGTYAAFIHQAPPSGATDQQISAIAAQSRSTPIYKIKDQEMKLLKDAFDFLPDAASVTRSANRSVASVASKSKSDSNPDSDQEGAEMICSAPAAKFNQCSWTCEGNKKGEKKCRTDLSGVSCVRRLCRANGQWAEPTRIPASERSACQSSTVTVSDCGGYW